MGSATARAPVAMVARRNLRRRPSTSTASEATKRPSPRKTSTPSSRKRVALSSGLMPARRRRMRSMARPKSPCRPSSSGAPNSACAVRARCQAREALITPFEGTQPTFRQSPPSKWRSTSATRAPRPAQIAAVTRPAVPPPSTTMW